MQRWKEEFVANTHRKCVHVHFNGNFDQGKVLYMEPDWSYLDFLNAASQRLNMVPAAKRVFNADGVEIDDCMMIEDDDILFFSHIDDFIPPMDVITEDLTRVEGEKIPHTVGGYKVGELLGRGGFGEVRVGEHHLTGERVALKFLRKSEIHSLLAAERTNTEIQCLQALKHNNIIRLQQHLESMNHVVLVFELMEGGDLAKFLVRRKNTGQSAKANLSEEEARHVFYQVLCAVSYAHNQHICHRDLKLENILLKDNSINLVKIADFGLSDFYRPGSTMKSSCGTLSFLAPEVFKGTANAGPPLDVWSLGVILFALLCGRLPFEGNDLASTKRPRDAVIKARIMKCQYKIDEKLGPEAKDLLRRILQGDPGERLTLPEIFNHVWLRTVSGAHYGDVYLYNAATNLLHSYNTTGHTTILNGIGTGNHGWYSSPFPSGGLGPGGSENTSTKSITGNTTSINGNTNTINGNTGNINGNGGTGLYVAGGNVDLLPVLLPTGSPIKQKRTNSGSSQKESCLEQQHPKHKKEHTGISTGNITSSTTELLMTVSEKLLHDNHHPSHRPSTSLMSESVRDTPNHLFGMSGSSQAPSRTMSCKALDEDTGNHTGNNTGNTDMVLDQDTGMHTAGGKDDLLLPSTTSLPSLLPSLLPVMNVDEAKGTGTFKLIPLRRSNSSSRRNFTGNGTGNGNGITGTDMKQIPVSGYYGEEDFLVPHRHSFTGNHLSEELLPTATTSLHHSSSSGVTGNGTGTVTGNGNGGNGNGHSLHGNTGMSSWRPSTTIASGGRRNILSTGNTTGNNTGNEEDVFSSPLSSMHKEYGNTGNANGTSGNGNTGNGNGNTGSRKERLRGSPRAAESEHHHRYYKTDNTGNGNGNTGNGGFYDFKSTTGNGTGMGVTGRNNSSSTGTITGTSSSVTGNNTGNVLSHSTETSPFFSRGTGPRSPPSLLHPASAQRKTSGGAGGGGGGALSLSPPPHTINGLLHDLASPSPPIPSYTNSPVVSGMKGRGTGGAGGGGGSSNITSSNSNTVATGTSATASPATIAHRMRF